MGRTFTVGQITLKVVSSMRKCVLIINIPFAFDIFDFLAPEVVDLLHKIQRDMYNNVTSHRSMNVVFTKINFTVEKGLAAQIVVYLSFIHV